MFMILLFNLHCAKKTEALLGTGPFVHKLFKYILYKGLCVLFAFVSETEKKTLTNIFLILRKASAHFATSCKVSFFPENRLF